MWDAEYVGPDAPERAVFPTSTTTADSVEYIDAPGSEHAFFDGEKYIGGFGPTQLFTMDYETLRARSAQLFRENIYARGLIRRLSTNIINTGLQLEAIPEESVVGVPEDSLSMWSEDVETRFGLYSKTPSLCDHQKRVSLNRRQRHILEESLIVGDCLLVLHYDPIFKTNRLEIISGTRVDTPLEEPAKGNTIKYGVELDADGKHVAYHVAQEDGTSKRVAAVGRKSKRRVAWMVYGTDHRIDDVRGVPLLGIVIQSIKEIDRYRDSTQRKATINSILAMFVKKTQDGMGTRSLGAGASLKGQVDVTDSDGTTKTRNIQKFVPGVVIEELGYGEEPVPHSVSGTDVNFGRFESAVLAAIAWCNEIPPEILVLSFNSNYSASQAATNEFKMFLNGERSKFGEQVLQPIYSEWLITEILTGRVIAPDFLDAMRDPSKVYIFAAWLNSDWTGAIKPSLDIVKTAKGYGLLADRGWITNARATREITGTKFSRNVRIQRKERELLAELGEILGPDLENMNVEDVSTEEIDQQEAAAAAVVPLLKADGRE